MKGFVMGIKIVESGNFITITGFPIKVFQSDIKKRFKTTKVLKIYDFTFPFIGFNKLVINKFFLPEFVYILKQIPTRYAYIDMLSILEQQTWLSNVQKTIPKLDTSLVNRDMTYSLKSWQKEFLNLYHEKKNQYLLNGYLLAFEQGLGKTFTSIALMHALKKDAIIIIAPKTLLSVWEAEIQKVFKSDQDIYIAGNRPHDARFFVVNYESIDKLNQVLPFIKRKKRIGIIVDESHNFRTAGTSRVKNLINISKLTKSKDILLMSGTPIKALGSEMIPMLELLDPMFDKFASDRFGKAFGLKADVALEILKNRLGMMMHRKTKQEVLTLPEKTRHDIKIKIPGSKKFELDSVKIGLSNFIKTRKDYYYKNNTKYRNDFNEVIDYLTNILGDDIQFQNYLSTIQFLIKNGYKRTDPSVVTRVKLSNVYEKNVLIPMLPSDLKKKFKNSKSVVKYLDLKIMGESLGRYLDKLRSEMFSLLVEHSPICEIIKNAEKKTILFTTYVDVVKTTEHYLKSACKLNSLSVHGETSKNIKSILGSFQNDDHIDALIATIKTLSTGVTLTEANTVIFLNKPWRDADRMQAEDRVHRLGQDTPVHIFNLILDTGGAQNLSTRVEDIVEWSRKQFEGIVG